MPQSMPPVAVDRHVSLLQGGSVAMGGSPWRLVRLRGQARDLLARASRSGAPIEVEARERAAAAALVDRGLLHPRPATRSTALSISAVVPAFGPCPGLPALLAALSGIDAIVVDDGTPLPSPVQEAAHAAGARYLRLATNQGPAAARNAGLAAASTDLVVLIDADCLPSTGWLDRLVPFFDDERVAVVAPRIAAESHGTSVLERYEAASSALDMGSHPALVRPGAQLGFVPSAALLVRRNALGRLRFDESLRLGEDVDLMWRLADAGWHVRYEPSGVVEHANRATWLAWARRRFEYGTSAVELERRHPGRLAPLRLSPWNAAAAVSLALGHPVVAGGVVTVAALRLRRSLVDSGVPGAVTGRVLAASLIADAAASGHALRREFAPLGGVALLAAPRSRTARVAASLMLVPIGMEWARERPRLDPVTYTAIRLVADASYGAGVVAACVQARTLRPLLPRLGRARRPVGGGASSTT